MTEQNSKRYMVTYNVEWHEGGLTREELKLYPQDLGACDAVILTSLIFGEDGSRSQGGQTRGYQPGWKRALYAGGGPSR